MNIIGNKQLFLQKELEEYENNTPMNDEERRALHEWVGQGYSVHENDCLAEDGHGNYLDFLDVYREEESIRETLSTLNEEEQEEFIAQLQGRDTIKSLRKRCDELHYKSEVYEKVLRRHHLMDEAENLIEEGRAMSRAFEEAMAKESCLTMEGGLPW
ncbi:MAG: hypothetical protein IJ803_02520 [Oribacterium sp.]|nr:hypothetical protein [Oribacterium sp.]